MQGKQTSSHKIIHYRDFLHKEYNIVHAPYDSEIGFYDSIAKGDTRKIAKLCEEKFSEKPGLGILSMDKVQSLKYHFVISTASIARHCINAGIPLSESYSMSDYYIQMVDVAKTIQQIDELHDEMCMAYAKRMKQYQKETICSRPVSMCIDYIYENLHTRITIDDLSAKTGLSNAYLSRLFKKETGYTVSRYILLKKIETAKSMLSYSDYPISDIAFSLAFPNQGYFTNVFKTECGMTPKQFRNSNALI